MRSLTLAETKNTHGAEGAIVGATIGALGLGTLGAYQAYSAMTAGTLAGSMNIAIGCVGMPLISAATGFMVGYTFGVVYDVYSAIRAQSKSTELVI